MQWNIPVAPFAGFSIDIASYTCLEADPWKSDNSEKNDLNFDCLLILLDDEWSFNTLQLPLRKHQNQSQTQNFTASCIILSGKSYNLFVEDKTRFDQRTLLKIWSCSAHSEQCFWHTPVVFFWHFVWCWHLHQFCFWQYWKGKFVHKLWYLNCFFR